MKKFFSFSILFVMLFSKASYAQSERTECEKAWRMERLRKRAEARVIEQHQDSIAYDAALAALKSGSWVLEANNVNFANGITRFVSPSTNYISSDEGNSTIQTAYSNFSYSPNGLGGVTLQGEILNVHMSVDKDGNAYYNFSIQGASFSATVNLTLTGGTNQASAIVFPSFSGQSITFDGYLFPYNRSTVFQGIPQW